MFGSDPFPSVDARPLETEGAFLDAPPGFRHGPTFSKLVVATFTTWAKHILAFSVAYLPLGVLGGVLAPFLAVLLLEGLSGSVLSPAMAVIGAYLVAYSLLAGGMTEYAVRRFRTDAVHMRDAVRRRLTRWWSILGATAGLILIQAAVRVAFGFIALAGSRFLEFVFEGVGAAIAIWIFIGLALYLPVIALEDRGAIGGLARSWELTKGHRLSFFGATLIVAAPQIALSAAVLWVGVSARSFLVIAVGVASVDILTGPLPLILVAIGYEMLTVRTKAAIGSRPTPLSRPPMPP